MSLRRANSTTNASNTPPPLPERRSAFAAIPSTVSMNPSALFIPPPPPSSQRRPLVQQTEPVDFNPEEVWKQLLDAAEETKKSTAEALDKASRAAQKKLDEAGQAVRGKLEEQKKKRENYGVDYEIAKNKLEPIRNSPLVFYFSDVEGDANMLKAADNTKTGVGKLTTNAFEFLRELSETPPPITPPEIKMVYGGDANDIEDTDANSGSIYYGLKDYDYVYGNRDLNKVRLFASMDMQYPDYEEEDRVSALEREASKAETAAKEARNLLKERVAKLGEEAEQAQSDVAQLVEGALAEARKAEESKKDAEANRKEFERTWWGDCKRGFAGKVDPGWPKSQHMSDCIGHFETLEEYTHEERKILASLCRLSTIVNETMGAAKNQGFAAECGVCKGLMKYFINRSKTYTSDELDWISRQPRVKARNQTSENFKTLTKEWLEARESKDLLTETLKPVLEYVKNLMEPAPMGAPEKDTPTLYDFLVSKNANVAYVVSGSKGDFDVASVHASMQTDVGGFKLNALLAEVDVDKRAWVKASNPSSDLNNWNRNLTTKIKNSIQALNGQKTFNKDVAEEHAWVAALALGAMGPVSNQLPFPVPFGKVNVESKQTVWHLGHIPNALPMVCHKKMIDENSEVWKGTTRLCGIGSDQLPMVNDSDYAVRVDTQYKRPGWCFAITMHRMLADRVRHQLAQQLVKFLVEKTSGKLDQATIDRVKQQSAEEINDPHALLDELKGSSGCNLKNSDITNNKDWLTDAKTTMFVGPEVWIKTTIDSNDTYGCYRLINAVNGLDTRILIVRNSCIDSTSVERSKKVDEVKSFFLQNEGNQASTMLCGMIGLMNKEFKDWGEENTEWRQAHGAVVRVMPTNFFNKDNQSYEKMALFNNEGKFDFNVRELENNKMIGVPYVAFTHVDPLLGVKIKLEKKELEKKDSDYEFKPLQWS